MPSSKIRISTGRYPCLVCEQQVTVNQKALQCDNCDEWTHFKCTPLTCNEYADLAQSSQDWYCGNCETTGVTENTTDIGDDSVSVTSDSEPITNDMTSSLPAGTDEVNGGDLGEGDAGNDETLPQPSEELLVVLEDDFVKNLGTLVDVLKIKFERIHDMQARNKDLENENHELRQQLHTRNEEIASLKQRLNAQVNSQEEIKRLNSVVRGLRERISEDMLDDVQGRAPDLLQHRQARMATVLGRMTNFLGGLSDDLARSDAVMPRPEIPSRQRPHGSDPNSADRPKPKKIKRAP